MQFLKLTSAQTAKLLSTKQSNANAAVNRFEMARKNSTLLCNGGLKARGPLQHCTAFCNIQQHLIRIVNWELVRNLTAESNKLVYVGLKT
jgi:hypothetical protein